jgi:SPP1 gp7 family putative phage head morphogenesis protein
MARLKKYPKDPTKSKKWEKKFEREIGKLIRRFKIELITSFNLAWNAGIIRNLESGKIDPSKFYKYVDDLAEKEIHKPAKKAAEKIIPKAYDQGVTFGSVVLGAPPEERFRIWGHLKFQLENTKTEFKGHSDDTTRRIKRIIGDGVQNERTQSQIIGNIQEEVKICENNAIRIARTEVQRAVNIGVKDRYVKEGVEYVKWLAAGDDRVCPQCESLDGKIFEINHAPQPPIHPNCRCTLIAAINPDRSKVEVWDGEKVTPPKKKETSPKEKKKAPKGDMMRPVAKPLSETTREELWENVKLAEDYVEGTDATYLIGKHYIHHGRAHTYIHELKEVPIKDITVTSEDMLDKIPVYKNRGTQAPPVDVSILPDGKYRLFNGHRRLKSAIARKEKNIFVEIIHKAEDITLKGE